MKTDKFLSVCMYANMPTCMHVHVCVMICNESHFPSSFFMSQLEHKLNMHSKLYCLQSISVLSFQPKHLSHSSILTLGTIHISSYNFLKDELKYYSQVHSQGKLRAQEDLSLHSRLLISVRTLPRKFLEMGLITQGIF